MAKIFGGLFNVQRRQQQQNTCHLHATIDCVAHERRRLLDVMQNFARVLVGGNAAVINALLGDCLCSEDCDQPRRRTTQVELHLELAGGGGKHEKMNSC